jgi:TRAP-type C4-dicarboxylate transport system permease small subunit
VTFARLEAALCRGLLAIAVAALVVMTLWTVVDVTTRYAIASPLRGSIDLVESTLVLVVFLALPECFRREEQVTVDVIDYVAGKRTVEALKLLAALGALAFLALLTYTGVQPLLDALKFGDRKPDLPIPIFALLAAIEVALTVSMLVVLAQCVARLRRLVRKPSS